MAVYDSREGTLLVLPDSEAEGRRIKNFLRNRRAAFTEKKGNQYAGEVRESWHGIWYIEVPFGTTLKTAIELFLTGDYMRV